MSLINDALKRTKDVQQQTPTTATGPALRPAEPEPAKGGGGAKTLLFFMVLAVILGNFLLWMAFKDRGEKETPVATAAPTTAAAPAAPAPAVASPPAAEIVKPPPVAATNTAPEIAAPPVNEEVAATTNTPATETASIVFAEPPKPTVLRLQSIIYGSRPSAMIGGKFLFIGDRIQGHQVIAIDKETVTLVGEGQTNVLSLP